MKKFAIGSLLILVAGCGAAHHEETVEACGGTDVHDLQAVVDPMPEGQLPEGVTPEHYALRLKIDPASEGFSGHVRVRVRFDAPHQMFWMHADGLSLDAISVNGNPCAATLEPTHGLARIACDRILSGTHNVEIDYHAAWPSGLSGLYRVTEAGASYAFTQFEATSARKAFPCFDEPRFKTPFVVSIESPNAVTALANTPEAQREELGETTLRRFTETPPLPTYLVAMAVGAFEIVEATPLPPTSVRDRALPLRGVALPGKGASLRRALDATRPILETLEAYTGIAYPFEKLDLVAVPDFEAGAMENPGLVTFREPLLLLDDNATVYATRDCMSVIAHELAHQWFGNYVTMPWWNDLWLNEAFATWLGTRAHAAAFPEHDADVDLLEYGHWAMSEDSLATARRIREPIVSNHDIVNAFDSITYGKGANVLAMFERWLGASAFQQAVQHFLRNRAFRTATTDDFLGDVAIVTGNTEAHESFTGFLDQPGVPQLTAEARCQEGSLNVYLSVGRYLPLGSAADPSLRWRVPVCVRVEGRAEPVCDLVVPDATGIALEAPCSSWFLPNADAAGYFRVAMEPARLASLFERGWGTLSVREKLAVADAMRAGLSAGTIPAEEVYRFAPYFARERHPSLVAVAISLVHAAVEGLVPDAELQKVRAYAERMLSPIAREVGWAARPGEPGDVAVLRSRVIHALAFVAKSRGARREALRYESRLLPQGGDALGTAPIADELADVVLRVAMEEGGARTFERAERLFRASTSASTRSRLLSAMAHAREPSLLDRAFRLSLDPGTRLNEMLTPLFSAAGRAESRDAAWSFVRANEAALLERMSEERAARLMRVAGSFCSEERATELEAAFAGRAAGLPGGPRLLASTLEQIRLCAARRAAQSESAARFFRQR